MCILSRIFVEIYENTTMTIEDSQLRLFRISEISVQKAEINKTPETHQRCDKVQSKGLSSVRFGRADQ